MSVTRVERELTRWQPEGPFIDPGLSEGPARFGRPTAGSVTGWDQFEVNRERFQVRRCFHCLHACIEADSSPATLRSLGIAGPLSLLQSTCKWTSAGWFVLGH